MTFRYDHKWLDHEERRDNDWNHYPRRPPPHDEWNNDWPQDEQPRQPMYQEPPEEERMEERMEDYPDHNNRRINDMEPPHHHMESVKEPDEPIEEESSEWSKNQRPEGDALSDISDDPDDILNRDDVSHLRKLISDGFACNNICFKM